MPALRKPVMLFVPLTAALLDGYTHPITFHFVGAISIIAYFSLIESRSIGALASA